MRFDLRLWVLPVLVALTAVATGCQSNHSAAKGIEPLTVLRRFEGNDPGLTQPGVVVVNSREELQALGSVRLADQQFDFERESVVVFTLGQRPTTGYWANIDAVQKIDGELFVQGIANRPSDKQVTATVLTIPYSAVVVPKTGATQVRREIESTTGWASPTTIVQVPTD